MDIAVATLLVHILYGYLAIGSLFALWFVARGSRGLDPRAAAGTIGFRSLLVPGTIALWPVLAIAVMRRRNAP